MKDVILGVLILFLVIGGMALWIWVENKNRRKFALLRLRESWGNIPQKEYTYEELEHIAQFFCQREKEGFYIDDITWNDLEMDRIFVQLNQSVSAVGGEVLYDLLRKPVFQQKELQRRQELINYFDTHEKERIQLQTVLSGIRQPGKVSVFEAIHVAKEVTIRSSRTQMLHFAAFFLSLFYFMAMPNPGVYIFLAVCVFNIVTYMGVKHEIDSYLTCFRCVIQLLQAERELKKLNITDLKEYVQQGETYAESLSRFQRGSSLVLDRSSAGGGVEGMMMDYVRMLTHIDLIKFNDMMENMKQNQAEIEGLIALFGYLDSMISIASVRRALPYYCIPQFQQAGQAFMEVSNLYHPLIKDPVANSIRAEGGILVTGSNASGKSTFLKNIAVNAILAQTIFTCTATSYEASYLKVMTSMALRDDLESGESYYIVEIRSLKRILDEAQKEGNILCIIDEVLRGTNTIERIGASSRILGMLKKENVLPFAATHDIELSYILENLYENYHFEEEIGERDVTFHYLLKKGRVTTRNAIRLLEMIGYDQEIVKQANCAVEEFEKTGVWSKLDSNIHLMSKIKERLALNSDVLS
nr:DNA mismatch repair protein MutS [uncultured Blautia sp.]